MTQAIKGLIVLLSSLVGVSISFAFILLEWPSLVINAQTLQWGTQHLPKKLIGITLEWNQGDVHTESISPFQKRIVVQFKNLCATAPFAMRTCFNSVDIRFAYEFYTLLPQLTEIGPISLLAGKTQINVPRLLALFTPEKQENKKKTFELPAWLKNSKFQPLELQISHYDVVNLQNAFRGHLEIHYAEGLFTAKAIVSLLEGKIEDGQTTVRVSARNQTKSLSGPWSLKGQFYLTSKKKGTANATFSFEPQSKSRFNYHINGTYRSYKGAITTRINGRYIPEKIEGVISQDVRISKNAIPFAFSSSLEDFPNIELLNCYYSYYQTNKTMEIGQIEFDCPVFVKMPEWQSKNTRLLAHSLKLTHRALLKVKAHLSAPFPYDTTRPLKGRFAIEAGQFFGPVVKTAGGINLDVSVVPGDPQPLKSLDGKLRLSVTVPEFGALVRTFAGTPLAIPAPLYTLRGPVQVSLSGDLKRTAGILSLHGDSKLSSTGRTQRIFVQTNGKVIVNTKARPIDIDSSADITLSDVHLGLPMISLGRLPQIIPDSRLSEAPQIKTSTLDQNSTLKFHSNVHIHTIHPLQIEANFASAPIVMEVNAVLKDSIPLAGRIQVEPFSINLLGKKTQIARTEIKFNCQNKNDSICINTPASKTMILHSQLTGQAAGEAAKTTTRSEPTSLIPVARIISSLLFGTPVEDIKIESNVTLSPPDPQNHTDLELLKIRKRY